MVSKYTGERRVRLVHRASLAGMLLALSGGCLDVVPAVSGFETDAERIAFLALGDADGAGVTDTEGDGNNANTGDSQADADTHKSDTAHTDAGDTDVDPTDASSTDTDDGQADGGAGNDDATDDAAGTEDTTNAGCTKASDCPDGVCKVGVCDLKTGTCSTTHAADKSPCDNGNPCEVAACAAGVCKADSNLCECQQAADCKDLDNNVCTGVPYCDTTKVPYKCATNPATVVKCVEDAENPCVVTACDKASGKCLSEDVPETKPPKKCDDGSTCTVGDVCAAGECVSGTNVCGCTANADCAAKEQQAGYNKCNGSLFCDLSLDQPTCKINPVTVAKCPLNDPAACASWTCEPTTGKCAQVPQQENHACDDGNPCTDGDICKSGLCESGTDLCFCTDDAACAKFDDGNPCNGTLYCNKAQGKCLLNPKTTAVCTGGTECAPNVCDPKTGKCGLKPLLKFTQCDADANPCTVDDTCDGAGTCDAGTNVCSCTKNEDCAAKEDGNACNGTLYCDKLASPPACKINPTTPVVCPVDNDTECSTNTCEVKTGKCAMMHKAEFAPCEDGDKCTVGDVCTKGTCDKGTDLCSCKADADCIDDGDICNGVPYCDKGASPAKCATNPTTVVSCPSATGCLQQKCAAKTGKCGSVDGATACDDANSCTLDSCGKDGVCAHKAGADGAACTQTSVCVAGACKAPPSGAVAIPASDFFMGCNATLDDACKGDEKLQHPVSLSALFIDRFEVTAKDYEACVAAGNCTKPADLEAACNYGVAERADHPINCVTWAQAKAYCAQATQRLPTEAEWEAIARGSCGHYVGDCAKSMPRYPWGLDVANCSITVMFGDTKAGCDAGLTRSVTAYAKDSSPYGVRGLGGNVSEWVADGYDPGPWAATKVVDPAGPATATTRVVRGGNFTSKASQVRAGARSSRAPDSADPSVGFRCAADLL